MLDDSFFLFATHRSGPFMHSIVIYFAAARFLDLHLPLSTGNTYLYKISYYVSSFYLLLTKYLLTKSYVFKTVVG